MPSSDEREKAIQRFNGMHVGTIFDRLRVFWDEAVASRDTEVQQLREERDSFERLWRRTDVSADKHASGLLQERLEWQERAGKAEAERDRYAAVIEKAKKHIQISLGTGYSMNTTYSILALVYSWSTLAERDAEKWDEGVNAAFEQLIIRQNADDVKRTNPYRAEQIRKEGKSNG
jgi:hypothetical protein